jgi:uncharacterized protein (TIGR03790 family)
VHAQSGIEVLVVMNDVSPASRRIAEYYAGKRAVPVQNLCRIRTAAVESVNWTTYEQEIERPVAACLSSLKDAPPIKYMATTLGVPMRVLGAGAGLEAEGASVDSELSLLYAKMRGKEFPRSGMIMNPFFGRRDVPFSQDAYPIYLVTRLAAYDVSTVLAMIDRSLQARNQGKVIVDMRSTDDSGGDQALADTAIFLPDERTVLDQTERVVYGEKDVIGYASWGSNDPARKRRQTGFQWLPGAVALQFVSTDARTLQRPPVAWQLGTWNDRSSWFAKSPQSLSADYLDEGATAAAGHVDEPYLQNSARPDYFFAAYLKGRTLAESYYLSIPSLSWQNVMFGDPLCQLEPVK